MRLKPWFMLSMLFLLQAAVAFAGKSIGPLAPFIQNGFQLTKAEIGFMPAAFFAGQAIVSIPAGLLVDRIGPRKMMMVMSASVGFFCLLMSLSSSYPLALCCLFLAGMGYGAMHPCTNKSVMHWFSRQQAGTAMGIKQMGITIGSALAAMILLPLAVQGGWRFAVECSVLTIFIVSAICFCCYRDKAQHDTSIGGSRLHSLRAILANKSLLLVSLATVGLNGIQLCFATHLITYLVEYGETTLEIAGAFLAVSETCGTIGRFFWGHASDKAFGGNRVHVLLIIAFMCFIFSLGFAVLTPGGNRGLYLLLIAAFGFCISGFNGVWMNFAAESVPHEQAGLASGVSLAIGSMGGLVIPPLFGKTIDATHSYPIAWITLSVCLALVAVLLAVQTLFLKPGQPATKNIV